MSKEILKKNLKAFKRNAYFWYRKQGFNAQAALSAARTQVILDMSKDAGTTQILWLSDDSADGPEDWGWDEKDIKAWYKTEHEVYGCVLKIKGMPQESLWGIFDPSNNYMKIVENELMQNYLCRIKGFLPKHV